MLKKLNIYFSYAVTIDGSYYHLEYSANTFAWIHVVLVYRGPENGQGISVYHNGELQGNDVWRSNANNQAAPSGVLEIGKLFERQTDARHAKLIMDELLIWIQQVSPADIQKAMQVAQSTADVSVASPVGRK